MAFESSPPLSFLLDLSNLAECDLWPPGAVAKLSNEDRAVIETINERSRSPIERFTDAGAAP
jgi:hypothetical protein